MYNTLELNKMTLLKQQSTCLFYKGMHTKTNTEDKYAIINYCKIIND